MRDPDDTPMATLSGPPRPDVSASELEATIIGDTVTHHREAGQLGPGDVLGRYVIVSTLGSGGMGVVYAAYDPELDRRIAIKLIRPLPGRRRGADSDRERLLREAQALAQLRHPNVVTVYDVGQHDGRIFVAMEFIDGPTLGRWLAETKPGRARIIELFCRAGRGLAAAHVKQMVHRDFKPDNVMIERDDVGTERVLVMDFGLASLSGTPDHTSLEQTAEASGVSPAFTNRLTMTGTVMGTPAYMAPEQHRGDPTDPRTDQFSFCVALYEALYGERPFAGETPPEVMASCVNGEIRGAPAGSRVPRWLREILIRGLAVNPIDRWPSMNALIEALGRDPTRARRRMVIAGAAVALLGAAYGTTVLVEQHRIAQCRTAADAIDQVWNDGTAANIEAAFEKTGLSYAGEVWTRLRPLLDERAGRWRQASYGACVDEPSLPAELRPVQRECFEAERLALLDRLTLLGEADVPVVKRAVTWRWSTRSEPCLDLRRLAALARLPPDPERHAQALELHRTLTRGYTLRFAGHYDEALALADEALAEAETLDDPRLMARALMLRGNVLSSQEHAAPAEEAFEDAFFTARDAGDNVRAAGAARSLTVLTGNDLARATDGRRWARHAEVLMAEAGASEIDRATLDQFVGTLEATAGRYPLALERLEAAREVFERELGPRSNSALNTLTAIGIVHDRLGDTERTLATLRQVLATTEEFFGEHHPETASAANNMGVALISDRKLKEAEVHLRRAVAIYEQAGLEAPLGSPLDNLSLIARQTGRHEEAVTFAERALEVRQKTLPDDHHQLGNTFINRGQALEELGRMQEATEGYRAALGVYERGLGPEHPRVADAAWILARALDVQGEHEQAQPLLERSLRIRRAALPPGHADILRSVVGVMDNAYERGDHATVLAERERLPPLGDAPLEIQLGVWLLEGESLLATGKATEALARFNRAAEHRGDPQIHPANQALVDFALARTLWTLGRDRERALALAQQAAEGLREVEAPADDIAEIERWIAEPVSAPAP